MQGAKGWQIALILVGLLGGVALILSSVMSSEGHVDMASSVNLVDVATGQLYEVSVEKTLSFPENNPETGLRTLVPAVKQDGKWVVPTVMLGGLKQTLKVENAGFVNFETGEFRVTEAGVKKISLR